MATMPTKLLLKQKLFSTKLVIVPEIKKSRAKTPKESKYEQSRRKSLWQKIRRYRMAYIGNEKERWEHLKIKLGLPSDEAFARLLLDKFEVQEDERCRAELERSPSSEALSGADPSDSDTETLTASESESILKIKKESADLLSYQVNEVAPDKMPNMYIKHQDLGIKIELPCYDFDELEEKKEESEPDSCQMSKLEGNGSLKYSAEGQGSTTQLCNYTGDKRCTDSNGTLMQSCVLKEEESIATGDRPYKCRFCAKVFSRLVTLKTHQYRCPENRPYKCQGCKKSFAHISTLKMHELIHT